MNQLIKHALVAVCMLAGFGSFSQAPIGGPKTVSTCEADCVFGSCKIRCESTGGTSGGGSVCGCIYGFPACGCGGGSSKGVVRVSETEKVNLHAMITHLQLFNSVEMQNLRAKFNEYLMLAETNPEGDFNPIIDAIPLLYEQLNPVEKDSYNTFLQTLQP